jgi:pimeloyl-ACP methyl ester carboxylesterase
MLGAKPPQIAAALRLMPNTRLHIISRARHIPFPDQPEAFNNALIEFLKLEALEVNI